MRRAPSIEPGDADASYLFPLVTREAEPFMPQNADKLPDAEIDLLRRWIDGGALENAGSKAAKPKTKDERRRRSRSRQAARRHSDAAAAWCWSRVIEWRRPPMARSLATSPWAPLVAVTSQRQVLLYNTTTLELVGVFPFPEGQPNVVRFSRDGQLLLAGGGRPAASGKVVVWDITTGERVFEVGNELDVVLAADISADHKRIALGGPQRIVRVYSTETGELQYEIAKHTEWVLAVEFSPDGVLLATADRNGGLCVWEADTGHEYLTLTGHTAAVNAVVVARRFEYAGIRLGRRDRSPVGDGKRHAGQELERARRAVCRSISRAMAGLSTCGRDQITRLVGSRRQATHGNGRRSATWRSASRSATNRRAAIAASWAGVVKVYKADDASVLGSLVTNPPPLEKRLASAQTGRERENRTESSTAGSCAKAETELAAVQTAFATAQNGERTASGRSDESSVGNSQIEKTRADSDAERTKIATALAQVQDASTHSWRSRFAM